MNNKEMHELLIGAGFRLEEPIGFENGDYDFEGFPYDPLNTDYYSRWNEDATGIDCVRYGISADGLEVMIEVDLPKHEDAAILLYTEEQDAWHVYQIKSFIEKLQLAVKLCKQINKGGPYEHINGTT